MSVKTGYLITVLYLKGRRLRPLLLQICTFFLSRWGWVWRGKARLCWKTDGVQESHWHIPLHLWAWVSAKARRRRLRRWGQPPQRGWVSGICSKGRDGRGLCVLVNAVFSLAGAILPLLPPIMTFRGGLLASWLSMNSTSSIISLPLSWPLSALLGPFCCQD